LYISSRQFPTRFLSGKALTENQKTNKSKIQQDNNYE